MMNDEIVRMMDVDSHAVYPCPVCRLGQIETILLMDALSCNLCRHIFTIDVETQQLKLPSKQPPLVWRWNGKRWVGAHIEGVELNWSYWLAAIMLIALPTTIIALTIYAFPPTPGTPLSWVPYVWAVLTFLLHLGIIGWLVIEIYQFPVAVYLRDVWQHRLRRG